jgi:hypothetical protein
MNPISAYAADAPRFGEALRVDAIRSNLEQFKGALRRDDLSRMQQLLAECEAESDLLEKRLLKGIDDETSEALHSSVRRARAAKAGLAKKLKQAPANSHLRKDANCSQSQARKVSQYDHAAR